ncbi:uncharacterized protein LAJ45_11179 [Morchella importuna]|uniref:uncharacterized protein n=1 Tax=Morchella importuna TaxID=1174673 RepID=UPI001E8D81C9|nr:uncharacterized protein LAJ45_11179 [Morchella importuna]KAH8144842.1 hypothetical protein LAJ45_11179 [Morchella importuna]
MQRFFEHRAVVSRLSVGARSYSTTQPKVPLIYRGGNDKYEKTLGNLKVGASTRVMYQGFTGSCATANALQSLDYGTQIVGGVSPNKRGAHLGLPLFPTMTEAMKYLKPDATAVFVAAQYAANAIKEAIEVEIPLVVAVAEHVPVHDILEIHSMLKTQSKTRLIGANSPGIINPHTRTRIGFMPYPSFSSGCIGIVAKSGTLSYEAVSSTTRVNLGQSLVIGVGGDWLAGTTLVDGVKVLLEDKHTKGIIIIGEVGGNTELEVADILSSWKGERKPVMGLIGGVTTLGGRVMGHAGAIRGVGDVGASDKIKALESAGVVMVKDPAQFGPGMAKLLGFVPEVHSAGNLGILGRTVQKRDYHTSFRPLKYRSPIQHRSLHLRPSQAADILQETGIDTHEHLEAHESFTKDTAQKFGLSLTIDRSSSSPCFFVSSPSKPSLTGFAVDYNTDSLSHTAENIVKHLELPEWALEHIFPLLESLWQIFRTREAYNLSIASISVTPGNLSIEEESVEFVFDDAAFRSAGRQKDLHALRDIENEVEEELEAEKAGFAYVKLPGEGANIGTLVNGAGLSMNTCDVIVHHGGAPTNFLDTGGRATKETVKEGFRLLLKDQRVKAIIVNIFGGITMCDMIAEGIVIAFEELGVKVPVVVRLRGTNEDLGRKIIRESGLPLFAFDDLESAVKTVISLANEGSNAKIN